MRLVQPRLGRGRVGAAGDRGGGKGRGKEDSLQVRHTHTYTQHQRSALHEAEHGQHVGRSCASTLNDSACARVRMRVRVQAVRPSRWRSGRVLRRRVQGSGQTALAHAEDHGGGGGRQLEMAVAKSNGVHVDQKRLVGAVTRALGPLSLLRCAGCTLFWTSMATTLVRSPLFLFPSSSLECILFFTSSLNQVDSFAFKIHDHLHTSRSRPEIT